MKLTKIQINNDKYFLDTLPKWKDITSTFRSRNWNNNDIGKLIKIQSISSTHAFDLSGLLQITDKGYMVYNIKNHNAQWPSNDELKLKWWSHFNNDYIYSQNDISDESIGIARHVTKFEILE